jgi:hypothetical protein
MSSGSRIAQLRTHATALPPRLPVPTVKDTIAKYLVSVQPLLTPSEFAATQKAATKLLEDPSTARLQEFLLNRAQVSLGSDAGEPSVLS